MARRHEAGVRRIKAMSVHQERTSLGTSGSMTGAGTRSGGSFYQLADRGCRRAVEWVMLTRCECEEVTMR